MFTGYGAMSGSGECPKAASQPPTRLSGSCTNIWSCWRNCGMAEETVGAPVVLSRRARKKLEKRRREAISFIGRERKSFEVMVQRAQRAGDVPDPEFVTHILSRLNDIEHSAATVTNADELDDLETDAEQQAELRAYICPHGEIEDEASLAIDLIQEWHVPRTVIAKLRDTLGQKVKGADKDLEGARSAL